jgi:hypothetical protein
MTAVASPRISSDPRWLAGAAAGLAAAALVLWTLRGYPLGLAAFWLSPLPLFLAGLGFGLPAASVAAATGALALLAVGPGSVPGVAFLALFAGPVLALLAAGLRGGRIEPGLPLAMLGLWPAAGLLVAAFALSGLEGGLSGAVRGAVENGLARMGVGAAPALVEQMTLIMGGAVAFWLALAWLANGIAAQSFLARRGLAAQASPVWSEVRLPGWYPVLPALAAAAWMLLGGSDLLLVSLLLALLVPLLFQGIAFVHARSRALKGRWMVLLLFYVLLIVFSVPAAALLIGVGVFATFARPTPPST